MTKITPYIITLAPFLPPPPVYSLRLGLHSFPVELLPHASPRAWGRWDHLGFCLLQYCNTSHFFHHCYPFFIFLYSQVLLSPMMLEPPLECRRLPPKRHLPWLDVGLKLSFGLTCVPQRPIKQRFLEIFIMWKPKTFFLGGDQIMFCSNLKYTVLSNFISIWSAVLLLTS